MYKKTSKQNPLASDGYHLGCGDKKKQKLENIHQRNISSCTNTGVHDFTKLNKQNIHQYYYIIDLGEICL